MYSTLNEKYSFIKSNLDTVFKKIKQEIHIYVNVLI